MYPGFLGEWQLLGLTGDIPVALDTPSIHFLHECKALDNQKQSKTWESFILQSFIGLIFP